MYYMSKTILPNCLGRMRPAHFDPSAFEDRRHPPNTTEAVADASIFCVSVGKTYRYGLIGHQIKENK